MKNVSINKYKIIRKAACRGTAVLLAAIIAGMSMPVLPVRAEVKDETILNEDGIKDYAAELKKRKAEPVQTNSIPSWPEGPAIGAAGAIVMDADSGEVLYGKNIEKHLYPASITKLITALLAYENLKPTDTVTFSKNAVHGIEQGSSHIGMDVGEAITVDQALYGLMVASANEVAVALGERVSGSEEAFAALMNERARELGCNNSNFVTLNGLHHPDHYTCAYDMALIAKEMFKYPDLINYMSQTNYHFVPSDKQPDDFWIGNSNDFLTGEIYDEDVIGGKTGYTDEARETLVTFAERDGVRLICVIMKEEPPHEYYDTIDLLNYAFDNFKQVRIAEEEDKYTLSSPGFLSFGTDIFGKSLSPYSIPEDATLMIPKDASFKDLTSSILPFSYTDSSQENVQDDSQKDTQETGDEQSGTSVTGGGQGAQEASTASAAAEAAAGAAPADTSPSADTKENIQADLPGVNDSGRILEDGSRVIGRIRYSFNGYDLGSADVRFLPADKKISVSERDSLQDSSAEGATLSVDVDLPEGSTLSAKDQLFPEEVHGYKAVFFNLIHTGAHGSIYLNILFLLPMIIAFSFFLCVIFFIHSFFAQMKKVRNRKRRRVQRTSSGSSGHNRSAGQRRPRPDNNGQERRNRTTSGEKKPPRRN